VKNFIDNTEVEKVLAKLEHCKDEDLAVRLLKEFNDTTKELGILLMNRDQSLEHSDWKAQCDKARQKVEVVLKKIEEI